jgi:polar amino acid transport system substrate-binding protein
MQTYGEAGQSDVAAQTFCYARWPMSRAEQIIDPRVADLTRAGEIRVALYLPQYSKDPTTGELRGWPIDLVRALGAHLGIAGVVVEHAAPPDAIASLVVGRCDAAIMGIDPLRAPVVDYSPPLVEADYTCLVPAGSAIHSVADADRPGVRIAAVHGHASTLALRRILKQATLVEAELLDPAFEILRNGEADLFASLRAVLLDYAAQLPGSRLLDGRYGFNALAIAVAKGQAGRLAAMTEFVEAAKSSGLVQQAIDRSGWRGIRVAPTEH